MHRPFMDPASRQKAMMEKVKYYSHLLEHASSCKEDVCDKHCMYMRVHIEHSRTCLLKECERCIRVNFAKRYHSHYCDTQHPCPVQGCHELVIHEYVFYICIYHIAFMLSLTSPSPPPSITDWSC
jgi:hypothetical protein